jgi:hypothetical protein
MISALSVDALEVDRGDAEVAVPELSLDDDFETAARRDAAARRVLGTS